MSAFIFVQVCGYICGPISLISNSLLLVIIRNTNSRHLTHYNVPLSLIAIVDIVLSATFLLCQPCVLVKNETVLVILLGPASFIHHIFAAICFIIFKTTLILSTLQIASLYLFKVLANKRKDVPQWQKGLVLAGGCLLALCIVGLLCYVCCETAALYPNRYEQYDRVVHDFTQLSRTPFYIPYSLSAAGNAILILMVLTCCIGCATVAITTLLSSGVMRFVKSTTSSSGVRFGQIANASRVNACSTAILVIAPLIVFTVFAVGDLSMNSYCIPLFLGAAFTPILNAQFIIFNIRTFRRALPALLSFKQKSIGPVSHISSDH